MSKPIRIRTTPNGGDKYVKIKLEQDFDFLEILSLNISQEDTYRKFSSDYGVVVGRVVINGGFGVPNAKVSIFIPLDDVDKYDTLIKGLYPYEKITDKNSDGVRYNLLTKDSQSTNECFTPVGTFPSKREVLDNEAMLEIYCKYYKFTTTTNHAGDFMIFGVPLGTYTVHVDADISDIGIVSQRPYDLITKGAPVSRFESSTKFSSGTNLNSLVQVKSLDAGVNVQPFWGDIEANEIGISRLDLDLNYNIEPAAIFMGSVFGDHDKNSVNKTCRPRKKMGELKEQVSGEGTIRMIRRTFDNKIEEFNVDGGEVIDEFGAWAYQIPMNLDYMVTDENGDLILSEDPSIGVPTRARVRFNVGMKNTGGEGRLRTRARYLVPNNPRKKDDIDYEFGPKTKDHSFRDLHWNKIYTVSNFIGRFQRNNFFTKPTTRNATGIKDVDGGLGNKTPFPYNKVNTETNPLFIILCIIIEIILAIVYAINAVIIWFINKIVGLINKLSVIRVRGLFRIKIFNKIGYVRCITIPCDDKNFAPGCSGEGMQNIDRVDGADDCLLFQLARVLDMFQFDFYNDWVNGGLYSFLLKYKKKKSKVEKFCETNCGDLAGGGIDGNNNGVADNRCYNSFVLDTCIPVGSDSQKNTRQISLREGVIKKLGQDFYYSATDSSTNLKLFATELVTLGSVFECDWQGIPKIQQLLLPTSYKLPPDTVELDDDGRAEVSGMVNLDSVDCGNFFSINCVGLHSNQRQVLNVRHICEMGVDIDQVILDNDENVLIGADCIIGNKDIDDNNGKWFRDVYLGLNNSTTPWTGNLNLNLPYSSWFNTTDLADYPFTNTSNNGADYISFRNYSYNQMLLSDNKSFGQPDHSYYFWFGLEPGNTGLDKMNKKFFTSCIKPIRDEIVIESNSLPDTNLNSNGSIIFSFIGGIGPFTYTITGSITPSGLPLNITPIVGTVSTSNIDVTINNLAAGTYLISGSDSLGTPISDTITVNGPLPLFCYSYVSSNATTDVASDGKITIVNAGGGTGVLHYDLLNYSGTILQTGLVQLPTIFTGLAIDDIHGYTVKVYDEATPVNVCITTGLTITGPSIIRVNHTSTNVHCFGEESGKIVLTISGGRQPYNIKITGPDNYETIGQTSVSDLKDGTYTVTVVDADALAVTPITIQIINENPEMIINEASASELKLQCDPLNYRIPFYITAGVSAGPVNVEYSLDGGGSFTQTVMTYVNSTTPLVLTMNKDSIGNYGIWIRFNIGSNPPCYSEEITYSKLSMELPPNVLGIVDGLGTNYTSTLEAIYHNKRQNDPNIATYNFSISHLNVGYVFRTPYTIEYTVENSTTVNTVTHYGGLVTLTGTRNQSINSDNKVDFKLRITDSKGCTFPSTQNAPYIAQITLPAAKLECTITAIGSNRLINGTGGFAPYFENGVQIPTTGLLKTNPTLPYVATITDSVGNTAFKIG